ncbi:hypothetical protein [Prescottella equi]|uniref:hypothetical protein n=1 Tax=Rhodococcus hoagii TaxID=43767 RepID=UPI001EEA2696|nr:hypothetical protein [Prescottella equi]
MSYSKFREKWFPRPDPRTPVTPEAIEHIEDGVARAHQAIDGRLGEAMLNATYAPLGGAALPAGGSAGQVLVKTADSAGWSSVKTGLCLTVAPSDAPEEYKRRADYVCTGVNDLAVIQAALDALPDNSAVSGEVLGLAGNFYDATDFTVSIGSTTSASVKPRKILRFQRGARINATVKTGRKAVIKLESPNAQVINPNIVGPSVKGAGTGIALGGDIATFGGRYNVAANMGRIEEPIISNLETGVEFGSIDGGPGVGASTGDCYGIGGYIFQCKTGIRAAGYSNVWYSPQVSDCDINIWVEGRRLETQLHVYSPRLVNWAQQAIRVSGGFGTHFYDTWLEHTSAKSAVPTEAILIGDDSDGANSVRFSGSTHIQLFDEQYAVRIEKASGLVIDELVISTSGAVPTTSVIRNSTTASSENNVIGRVHFGPLGAPAHTLVSGSGAGHLRIERKPGTAAFSSTPTTPETVVVPTSGMSLVIGAPALGTVARTPVWLLDPAAAESVGGVINIPAGWKSADIDVLWCSAAAGTGDVCLRFDYSAVTEGAAAPDPASGAIVTAAVPGNGVVVKTRLASAKTVAGGAAAFEVVRVGGEAADTLPVDIGVVSVILTRVS